MGKDTRSRRAVLDSRIFLRGVTCISVVSLSRVYKKLWKLFPYHPNIKKYYICAYKNFRLFFSMPTINIKNYKYKNFVYFYKMLLLLLLLPSLYIYFFNNSRGDLLYVTLVLSLVLSLVGCRI